MECFFKEMLIISYSFRSFSFSFSSLRFPSSFTGSESFFVIEMLDEQLFMSWCRCTLILVFEVELGPLLLLTILVGVVDWLYYSIFFWECNFLTIFNDHYFYSKTIYFWPKLTRKVTLILTMKLNLFNLI